MRLPTFGKPRVISCAELFTKHIALPRGCFDAAIDLLAAIGIRPELRDERYSGPHVGTRFLGALTAEQQAAVDSLMAHDTGVLAATTAFDKTVVAAKLIGSGTRIRWSWCIGSNCWINGWRGYVHSSTSTRTVSGSFAAGGSGRRASSMSPPSKAW